MVSRASNRRNWGTGVSRNAYISLANKWQELDTKRKNEAAPKRVSPRRNWGTGVSRNAYIRLANELQKLDTKRQNEAEQKALKSELKKVGTVLNHLYQRMYGPPPVQRQSASKGNGSPSVTRQSGHRHNWY